MNERLSSPLDAIRSAYDVVVVGSGYGGGVTASRLARAGLKVCVIERGREFLTGEFPARLPELRRELQVVSGKMRSGRLAGLFDFRLGSEERILLKPGDIYWAPKNYPHGDSKFIGDPETGETWIVDIFTPPREDYRNG